MASTDGATTQAQEKAQEVAGQAKEQVKNAASTAKDQLRTQVDTRSTQAGEQVSQQASDIRTVAQQLREQGKDKPAQAAEQAADRIERVGSYLSQSDADTILRDVEQFAREKPMAVIAGGLALGFFASRFLKASQSDRYYGRPQQLPNTATRPAGTTPAPTGYGTTTGTGYAGTGSDVPTGNELSSGVGATERVDPLGPAGVPDAGSRLGTPATPATGGTGF